MRFIDSAYHKFKDLIIYGKGGFPPFARYGASAANTGEFVDIK
jgi:hypothetical protein